jgi:hypothetical protein
MRLWSLHPKYLDARGLVTLWREALLAQAVLRGQTRGYRWHPQLQRFRAHRAPIAAVSLYLDALYREACSRGYAFDRGKFRATSKRLLLPASSGQIEYEWSHLLRKLRQRSAHTWRALAAIRMPQPHPLFKARAGPIESWERVTRRSRPPKRPRRHSPGSALSK